MPTSLQDVIPQLRDAIGPVILISGVGLLLLSFTNRLGRAIDRARLLDAELPKRDESERGPVRAQISIIYRRAKIAGTGSFLVAVNQRRASKPATSSIHSLPGRA